MKKSLSAALACALSLMMTGQAFALGTASYSSELISTRSLGQGGTGVAGVHEDPISGFTNPAALSFLKGSHATVGLSYINASPSFKSNVTSGGVAAGSAYTGSTDGSISGARVTEGVVPNLGASTQIKDTPWTVGLALVTPFGLETHWNGDSPVRYQATDARLRVIDIVPSASYKVNDQWSVGAGVDYMDTIEGQLDKKINTTALNASLGAPGLAPDANSRLNGNGSGVGFHVGGTYRYNEHHQIGVVYHSLVKMNLVGNTELTGLSGAAAGVFGRNFSAHAEAALYIPQNVQVGYAWMPNDTWQVEADAAWWDFSQARQLSIDYSKANLTANQTAVLTNPASNPTTFNPRKTINFGAGVNHVCTDKLQTRAGFYYQAASLPERFFDAAIVDLPRYALTAGAGWKFTDALHLDVAYNAVFFHSRAIDAPGTAASGNGYKGNFRSFGNVISAGLTWRTDAHL